MIAYDHDSWLENNLQKVFYGHVVVGNNYRLPWFIISISLSDSDWNPESDWNPGSIISSSEDEESEEEDDDEEDDRIRITSSSSLSINLFI